MQMKAACALHYVGAGHANGNSGPARIRRSACKFESLEEEARPSQIVHALPQPEWYSRPNGIEVIKEQPSQTQLLRDKSVRENKRGCFGTPAATTSLSFGPAHLACPAIRASIRLWPALNGGILAVNMADMFIVSSQVYLRPLFHLGVASAERCRAAAFSNPDLAALEKGRRAAAKAQHRVAVATLLAQARMYGSSHRLPHAKGSSRKHSPGRGPTSSTMTPEIRVELELTPALPSCALPRIVGGIAQLWSSPRRRFRASAFGSTMPPTTRKRSIPTTAARFPLTICTRSRCRPLLELAHCRTLSRSCASALLAAQLACPSPTEPHAGAWLTAIPPRAMQIALRRRLRLPLPLCSSRCGSNPRCGGAMDPYGDHAVACPRTGLLAKRPTCQSRRARLVPQQWLAHTTATGVPANDRCRLDVARPR